MLFDLILKTRSYRRFYQSEPIAMEDLHHLIEYARLSKARKIYTTHGFREFPRYLRSIGLDALPVEEMRQLSLF